MVPNLAVPHFLFYFKRFNFVSIKNFIFVFAFEKKLLFFSLRGKRRQLSIISLYVRLLKNIARNLCTTVVVPTSFFVVLFLFFEIFLFVRFQRIIYKIARKFKTYMYVDFLTLNRTFSLFIPLKFIIFGDLLKIFFLLNKQNSCTNFSVAIMLSKCRSRVNSNPVRRPC